MQASLRAFFLYPMFPCDRKFWAQPKVLRWWLLQIPAYFPAYVTLTVLFTQARKRNPFF